jgi:hypothetical protein
MADVADAVVYIVHVFASHGKDGNEHKEEKMS